MNEKKPVSRIRQARLRAKKTQQDVADHLGISRNAVSLWESENTSPQRDRMVKLAQFLEIGLDYLMGFGDELDDVIPGHAIPNPQGTLGAPTLPVLGITMGGRDDDREPDFWMNGEVVNYVARPRKMDGHRAAFGLYVGGTSMEPRYRARDLVIVEKASPAPGDDVVIELRPKSETEDPENPSFIKEFIARRGSFITVRQLNPPKDLDFDLKEIKNLYRVVPLKELLG
ncbi:XRE family transcriptional regulator [Tardiphaga sp. 841_E9_N1_2]|uniref:XRE family transcriptional regulator n=1 Tax=Tardiphaga sp. 841_E9_N1_2 TaxID=3240762 RepID=UPI003F1E4AA3